MRCLTHNQEYTIEEYCLYCGKPLEYLLLKDEKELKNENLWTIEVDGNKTTQQVYEECASLFPCWKFSLINLSTITDERTGSYIVSFNANVEADEKYKNMSAGQIKKKNIKAITLKERLLLEMKYFKETGKHLDIDNITLCAGSRHEYGGVPCVNFCDGKVRVNWYGISDFYDCLRAREAISINS